jgi:hypothetical protein
MAELGRRYVVHWTTVREVVRNKTWREEVILC